MLVSNVKDLNSVIEKINNGPPFLVYDLETTGLDPFNGDRLIGVAALTPDLKKDTFQSYYIPFRHENGENLPLDEFQKLKNVLEDSGRGLMGWNIKFDHHFTEAEGVEVENQHIDGMLGMHLNNENEFSFALVKLGQKYIDKNASEPDKELQRLLKERKLKKGDMRYLSPEEVAPYAEQDVILTWKLCKLCQDKLDQQGLTDIWIEINEYSKAITNMEKRGVLIDPNLCQDFKDEAEKKCEQIKQEIEKHTYKGFNPNSVPQMRKVLGQKETDKHTLAKSEHPIAPLVIDYRAWSKAVSTYYNGFLELADPNYRIHPNLNIIGTISGRLSCQKPNLQALPKKKDQYRVRDLVIAPPGHVLMAWDWSQAELRLLAHYTQDPFFISAFQENRDIHQATAEALGIPRNYAKRINFGIVYGLGADGLSDMLGIPYNQAKQYLNKYHKNAPGVRKLYNTAQKLAEKYRYIPMWTGRLRHYRQEDATHKAMSNLIQGGVAEMMRIAVTELNNYLRNTDSYMNLQVHDEILFEIPMEEAKERAKDIKEIMENFEFKVPIIADGKIGLSWANMTDIEFKNNKPDLDQTLIELSK